MSRVGVVGMGLMGSAVAAALVRAGHSVAVWNRTSARCAPLVELGATARPLDELLAQSDVVLLCLLNHANAEALLEPDSESLRGKVIVNLITGSPDEAAAFAAFAHAAGARYLDGAIFAFPEEIGAAQTVIAVSGELAIWDEYGDIIRTIAGGSIYTGGDVGTANRLDAGLTGGLLTVGICAFLEAVAYLRNTGVDLAQVDSMIDYWMSVLGRQLHDAVNEVRSGTHVSDQTNIATYLAAMDSWTDTMRKSSDKVDLMTAATAWLATADRRGHGHLAISTLALDEAELPQIS